MTSDELQNQLNDTWYREQSADDAHDSIWGEPFDGYTISIEEIEKTRKTMYARTVGLSLEESDKLRTWIDATLSVLANADDEPRRT